MSNIDNLIEVMKALRDPESGCPWDIKQTSASIASYTLEETHEALDAIERDDMDNLKEELGDLLFHIIFHVVKPKLIVSTICNISVISLLSLNRP